jgi:DNA-directed RNA polymerase subunit RPC12/RpoP
MLEIKCAICGAKVNGNEPFKFHDGLYRCVKCAAAYFFAALDRLEDNKARDALTTGFDSLIKN